MLRPQVFFVGYTKDVKELTSLIFLVTLKLKVEN